MLRLTLFAFEAILLVFALSLDSLAASFAFGIEKIKVPILSAISINIVCSSLLFISLIFGSFIRTYIPSNVATYISFGILLALGILRLLDIIIKKYIKKKDLTPSTCKNGFGRFILTVYADSAKADANDSKTLSLSEAITLALALSIDSLAAGFGVGVLSVNHLLIVSFAFIFGMIAVELGCLIGRKIASITSIDLSWISGVVLIILAFLRL